MKTEYIFPSVLIALDVVAAAVNYAVELDWRMAITLPADDYRRAYIALVSRNEDISKAFMEFVNERA